MHMEVDSAIKNITNEPIFQGSSNVAYIMNLRDDFVNDGGKVIFPMMYCYL